MVSKKKVEVDRRERRKLLACIISEVGRETFSWKASSLVASSPWLQQRMNDGEPYCRAGVRIV